MAIDMTYSVGDAEGVATMKYSKGDAVVDRFKELENRIDEHIAQEAAVEAAQDAAGRELRVLINRHSEERCREIEAAEEFRRRERERAQAYSMMTAFREYQHDTFTHRNIGSAAITAALGILYATGGMSLWLAMSCLTINAALFIHNLVAYATRNNKKGE